MIKRRIVKPGIGIKESVVILLVIVLIISEFIRHNYYINIATILAGTLIISIVGVFEPLIGNLKKNQKNLLLYASPVINILIVIFAIMYIFFFKNSIFVILALLACTADILLSLIILKNRNNSNYILLFAMIVYLFATVRGL